jgi:ADP-ribosylglycohydrolase
MLSERIAGLLLGTAVGDALGLPREGLSRRRAQRLYGTGPVEHRLLLSRGMLSDDTEHACMTAQALLATRFDEARFTRSLAWRLRGWLLALPPAVGWGTLKAILKLWFGFPPSRSGVWSAGNGPAMRAPIIGACFAQDRAALTSAIRASTRLTHRHPRAEMGALAIAVAAAHAVSEGKPHGADSILEEVRGHVSRDEELVASLDKVERHLSHGARAIELADALGLDRGVSGYMNHTVPVALYCWLRYRGDFRGAIESVIGLGGDTDSTAALVGALAGAECGVDAIPTTWRDGLTDWPRSAVWLRSLATRLGTALDAESDAPVVRPLPLFWPAIPLRNLFFLALVMMLGLRRLLPPY